VDQNVVRLSHQNPAPFGRSMSGTAGRSSCSVPCRDIMTGACRAALTHGCYARELMGPVDLSFRPCRRHSERLRAQDWPNTPSAARAGPGHRRQEHVSRLGSDHHFLGRGQRNVGVIACDAVYIPLQSS
jgi:hypothetical protein